MKATIDRLPGYGSLRKGDIVKIPAECRLRVSPKTLSKMGLSVGFTSRSANRVEAVRDLVSRSGEDTFLAVTEVSRENPSGPMSLVGNSVRRQALAEPPVRYAVMSPFRPMGVGAETARTLLAAYRNELSAEIVSKIGPRHADLSNVLACRGPLKFDLATAAVESCRAFEGHRSIRRNAPDTDSIPYPLGYGSRDRKSLPTDGSGKMTEDEVADAVTAILLSYPDPSGRNADPHLNKRTITAWKCFLERAEARGMEFYRPNAAAVLCLASGAFSRGCEIASSEFARYERHFAEFEKLMAEDLRNVRRRKRLWSSAPKAAIPGTRDMSAVRKALGAAKGE